MLLGFLCHPARAVLVVQQLSQASTSTADAAVVFVKVLASRTCLFQPASGWFISWFYCSRICSWKWYCALLRHVKHAMPQHLGDMPYFLCACATRTYFITSATPLKLLTFECIASFSLLIHVNASIPCCGVGQGGLMDHGVHAFIVPLRDETSRCLPGVEIHDCGYKASTL